MAWLAVALVWAPAASAHATVASSNPADGSRLAAAPTEVSITFDESVGLDLGYLRVVDSHSIDVTSGPAIHPDGQGQIIAVPLKAGLGDGSYIASWRVISADSHPVEGTIAYVVGNGPLTTSSATAPPVVAADTAVAFDVARTVSYAGLAVLGGGWLLLSVWPAGRGDPRARRALVAGWATVLLGSATELLLQGPYAAGVGPAAIGRIDLLVDTIGTTYGRLHVIRLLLLAAVGFGLDALFAPGGRRPTSRGALPGVLLFVAVVYTFSADGHAGVARPAWLALTSDMAHLVAVSAWIGGLVLLAVALLPGGRPQEELRAVLPIFSRVAFGAVLVIAATGTYQAWRESGTVRALTTTTYGQLILVKVALFVAVVGVANLSRMVVQRRYVLRPVPQPSPAAALLHPVSAVSAGPGGLPDRPPASPVGPAVEQRRLRRSVLTELALAAVVLTVTGVLVALPPGRAAVAGTPAAVTSGSSVLAAGRSVRVSVDPAQAGVVTVTVALVGGPEPEHLAVTAALPARQLGPLPVPLIAAGPLTYRATGFLLPTAGEWTFAIVVQTSEFDAVTTTVTLAVS